MTQDGNKTELSSAVSAIRTLIDILRRSEVKEGLRTVFFAVVIVFLLNISIQFLFSGWIESFQTSFADSKIRIFFQKSGFFITIFSILLVLIVGQIVGRYKVVLLAAAMVAFIFLNVIGQLWLNDWHKTFFDALEQRDLPEFINQLFVFLSIVSVLLVLGVGQTWVHAVLKIRMREIITTDVVAEWLKPKRAYRMPLAGEIGSNPDQRIHDDARSLSDITTDFCVGLVHASLTLVSFVGVLWVLSERVVFSVNGSTFNVPGYMVWCAIAYAVIGSWLTWRVGRPLVPLNAEMRAREADFRFTLLRVNESSEAIALYGGENDERKYVKGKLGNVISMMMNLTNAHVRLMWVTASYGWMAIVVPFIVTAPGYFAGTLSFGDLMKVVGAFTQVQSSLRWYVDNYPNIAAWQAMSWRVITYRNVLGKLDKLGVDAGIIEVDEKTGGKIIAGKDFSVAAPHGQISVKEQDFKVSPGEHVLVAGLTGSGKSTFFRALARLWPWGAGRVELPSRSDMMFLPHAPYIPLGTYREVLTYPHTTEFSDEAVTAALERLDLGHRADVLDRVARWDKELSLDEQQRIAYVRVLLHKPEWVLEDDSMSALEEDVRAVIQSIFEEELVGTAVVTLGRDEFQDHFYQRVYHLQSQPPGLQVPFQWQDFSKK
ncbi:MAG: ABC transporter ATP-binding protein/permease [Alphaproteobacteria bacterium]